MTFESEKRVPCGRVRDFTRDVFLRCGLNEAGAVRAADVLCTADEWGIRSHGVARLRFYCEMLAQRRINPLAQPHIIRDRPSMVLVDGDNGLGMLVACFANEIAINRAKETGIGWVHVINSNHFGIAGYYAIQGLQDDLIGIAMTNTPPLVAPFGGMERRLGTNPISMAIPACNEPPVVIDVATSAISLGAVENAHREGDQVPPWCLIDTSGVPSTQPRALLEGGSLLPLGGARATGGHKGYCLASMIDLLCGVFPGASWGPFVPPFLNHAPTLEDEMNGGVGHLFGAISTGIFEDSLVVKSRVDQWIATMRNTKACDWAGEVLVPGDPERRAKQDSARHGLPLEVSVAEDLRRLGQEFGLKFEI